MRGGPSLVHDARRSLFFEKERSSGLVDDVLAFQLGELVFDPGPILCGMGRNAQCDAAVAKDFLVSVRIGFGYAETHQAADGTAGDGSRSTARQGRGDGPGDQDAEARN